MIKKAINNTIEEVSFCDEDELNCRGRLKCKQLHKIDITR